MAKVTNEKMTRDKQKTIWLNEMEMDLLNVVLSSSGVNYAQFIRKHLYEDAKKLGVFQPKEKVDS